MLRVSKGNHSQRRFPIGNWDVSTMCRYSPRIEKRLTNCVNQLQRDILVDTSWCRRKGAFSEKYRMVSTSGRKGCLKVVASSGVGRRGILPSPTVRIPRGQLPTGTLGQSQPAA